MKKYALIVLIIICLSIVWQGCNMGASRSWKNDRIDAGIRTKLGALNKKLFNSLMAGDAAGVRQLMAPQLITGLGNKIDTIVNATGILKAKDYALLDEYYTTTNNTNITNTLPSVSGKRSDYIVTYQALNKEMYTALMVSKNLPVNCIIIAIYGKYGSDWKLNILQVGEYSVLNKTAPDYYDEAKKLYQAGSRMDAVNMMIMASELGQPGGNFFRYKNEDEMKVFFQKIIGEANAYYHFPITVGRLKTKPQLFAVSPQYISDAARQGVYPLIRYKSTIKLTDTVALKEENQAIQKTIGTIFNDIDKNNNYIIYQVLNQFPDGKTVMQHYGFIQKVK